MARRFVRSNRGGLRRSTEWAATTPETAWQALAAATAILDSTFTPTEPQTVIRVRGMLGIESDNQAVSEEPFGAFGVCVVSDQANAIGITAIPTPYTDPESDLWLLHQFWNAPVSFASAVGIWTMGKDYVLDSKAMRRMSSDQTLAFVIENGAAGHGAIYRLDVRVLLKLGAGA